MSGAREDNRRVPQGFSSYMQSRRAKLRQQDRDATSFAAAGAAPFFCDDSDSDQGITGPGVFQGLRIHVNGYTGDTHNLRALKEMILENGGEYDHYYSPSSTTHVIALEMPPSKRAAMLKSGTVLVTPSWIVDSVAAKSRLSVFKYMLPDSSTSETGAISAMFQKITKKPKLDLELEENDNNDEDEEDDDDEEVDISFAMDAESGDTDVRITGDARDPGFLESYFKNSRLHHLSRWRQELIEAVKPIKEQLNRRKIQHPNLNNASPPRTLFYVDMDCFFASVSLLARPDFKDKPVGISHAAARKKENTSSSTIASCNYKAREFGVKNGMWTGKAMRLCPDITLLPYDFESYRDKSRQFYNTLASFADDILAISCDEALLEVTTKCKNDPTALAEHIRSCVFKATGCAASIGIGKTMVLARLAARKAKPNGVAEMNEDAFDLQEWYEEKITSLPSVGPRVAEKLETQLGVQTIGQLRLQSVEKLSKVLGPRAGTALHMHARGLDSKPPFSNEVGSDETLTRKTVGVDVTYGIRFEHDHEVTTFMQRLSKEVSNRLNEADVMTGLVTLKVLTRLPMSNETQIKMSKSKFLGHGPCNSHSRSSRIEPATNDADKISEASILLLRWFNFDPPDLRGLGISCSRLVSATQGPARDVYSAPVLMQLQGASSGSSASRKRPLEPPQTAPYTRDNIDWNMVEQLPPSIQAELKGAFGSKANIFAQTASSLHRGSRGGSRGRASLRRISNLRSENHSVLDMLRRAAQPETDEDVPPGVDPEVFKELPLQIQNEVRRQFGVPKKPIFSTQQKITRETPKPARRLPDYNRGVPIPCTLESESSGICEDIDLDEEAKKMLQGHELRRVGIVLRKLRHEFNTKTSESATSDNAQKLYSVIESYVKKCYRGATIDLEFP